MAPIAMPAIAPLESPDEEVVGALDSLADDDDVDVVDDGDDVAAADDDADADVGVPVDKLEDVATTDELAPFDDNVPPSTCASITTEFVEQQSVLSPQHQSSLSALPSHGVTRTFPKGYLGRHMLRQFLLLTSLSVQKSTQYLINVSIGHLSSDICTLHTLSFPFHRQE